MESNSLVTTKSILSQIQALKQICKLREDIEKLATISKYYILVLQRASNILVDTDMITKNAHYLYRNEGSYYF